MSLIKTLRYIVNHPLNRSNKLAAVKRYFNWQLSSRLNPHPVIYPFVEGSFLVVQKSMTGATGNVYCGLHEFNDMGFVLHFLRPGDLFFDIGANIGSYTILASAVVGANTVSFEPVPSTFRHLQKNVTVNNVANKVTLHNMGLGGTDGVLPFTAGLDTVNHIAAAGENVDTIPVPVKRLEDVCANTPVLMKIDVEGYESEVMKGAGNFLADNNLKALIMELNGSGKRYGFDDASVHAQLLAAGFQPHVYDPFNRKLDPVNYYGKDNTIYIRDQAFVRERLAGSRAYKILDVSL